MANFLAGQYDEALAGYKALLDRCEKGETNCAVPHFGLAMVYSELSREKEARAHAVEFLRRSLHEEAIRAFERGVRLDPVPDSFYFRGLAGSYAFLGRHEEAIEAGRKAVEAGPNDPMAHVNLAAAYGIAGGEEEARAEVAEVLRIDPNFSLERYEKGANKYRNEADKEMHIEPLRKAGLE